MSERLDTAYWALKHRWAKAIGYDAPPCPGTRTLEAWTARLLAGKDERIAELERENEVLRAGIVKAETMVHRDITHLDGMLAAAVELCRKREGEQP